jgi:hypothetical protein
MTGHQDHLFIRAQERITLSQFSTQFIVRQYAVANPDQRINNRITRDENTVIGNFPATGFGVSFPLAQNDTLPDARSVYGLPLPARESRDRQYATQPHMPHRDALIKRGQAGRNGGCCITVNQHHIRFKISQNWL